MAGLVAAEVTDVLTGLTAAEVIGVCHGLVLDLSLVALLPVEVCGENKGREKLPADDAKGAGLALGGVALWLSSMAFFEAEADIKF
jgi:hypothetical protein